MSPGHGRILQLQSANARPVEHADIVPGGYDGRAFTRSTPFRIASVSKLMVGELMRRLHAKKRINADADVSELMDYPLRHPEFPETPITLRRLVSHSSGIIDPPVYWMAAPGNIRDLISPDIWEPGVQPGTGFRYSNLNCGLAATVMEAAAGERFDRLFTRYVAEPLGLNIGFNWSGVSAAKRARGFPAMRGGDEAWEVQVDGADTLAGGEPAILREPGFHLDDYEPGTNGTLFSPQGGLRASLDDLLVIGRDVVLAQPQLWQPRWRAEDTGGRGAESEVIDGRGGDGGHFVAFGEGIYVYPDGPLPTPSRAWVGHHGEAYGVYCGIWVVPNTGAVFVHADLGSPPDGSPLTGARPNNTELATNAFEWAYRMGGAFL